MKNRRRSLHREKTSSDFYFKLMLVAVSRSDKSKTNGNVCSANPRETGLFSNGGSGEEGKPASVKEEMDKRDRKSWMRCLTG